MKTTQAQWLRIGCLLAAGPLVGVVCTGCVVAGYSSRGGGFIFPGFGLLLVVLLVLFLLRRR